MNGLINSSEPFQRLLKKYNLLLRQRRLVCRINLSDHYNSISREHSPLGEGSLSDWSPVLQICFQLHHYIQIKQTCIFDCEKCIHHQTHRSSYSPTTIHEFIGAYFKHIPPAQIKKQKMYLLNFNFREILFYKYHTDLQKITPVQAPLDTCNSVSQPQITIRSQHLVWLIECFPKWYDMTQQCQKLWRRQISGKSPGCRPMPTRWGLGRSTAHPKVT